jgi:hypothetical protein
MVSEICPMLGTGMSVQIAAKPNINPTNQRLIREPAQQLRTDYR